MRYSGSLLFSLFGVQTLRLRGVQQLSHGGVVSTSDAELPGPRQRAGSKGAKSRVGLDASSHCAVELAEGPFTHHCLP